MKKHTSKLSILESLPSHEIPMLTLGSSELLTALANEDNDYEELAAILENFPTIAVKIIALANSVWSTPVKPITTLDAACSRLGMNIVKSVSVALAVSAPFNLLKCGSFNPEYFWSSTLLVADTATLLAPVVNLNFPLNVGTVRTASLFHNIGLLFFVHYFHEETEKVLQSKEKDNKQSLRDLFFDELGITVADAGSFLAKKWGLPDAIMAVMSAYDDPCYEGGDWPLVATVSMAINRVSAFDHDDPFIPLDNKLYPLIDKKQLENLSFDFQRKKKNLAEIAKSIAW